MSDDPPFLSLVQGWQHDQETDLASTRIFTLRERRGSSPTRPGVNGRFVYLDSADWVNVIALTDDEQVVLIEQFRHGTAEVTLEIPGGLIDPGEVPLAAGVRELLEETGFGAGQASVIGRVSPNPAILNNHCYTVLVRGVRRVADPAPETHEEIGVRLAPLAQVSSLVATGLIHHALVVAAFHHLTIGGAGGS